MNNNFIALSSPFSKSAIAVIRINGDKAIKTSNLFLGGKNIQSNDKRCLRKFLIDGNFIDEVVINIYHSPTSYTGDDLIEIMCHGSTFIIEKIINAYISKGIRYAGPGEFTKRGLTNSKIDYLKAESINELVNAENKFSHDVAINSYDGKINNTFKKMRAEINFLWAHIEVDLDYPEFNNETFAKKSIQDKLIKMLEFLKQINNNSEKSLPFLKEIKVTIVGKPNVGKSTLLNELLLENKAIISKIPGTTRDIVEGTIVINDQKIKLLDTAGIRKTKNMIEKEGIKRTLASIENSNLVIYISDDGKWEEMESLKQKEVIRVYNKTDLLKNIIKQKNTAYISAKEHKIDELINRIKNWVNEIDELIKDSTLLNYRQWDICQQIEHKLEEWLKKFNGIEEDLHSFYLNEIKYLFDELLGKSIDEDLENTLFNNFCVGK